MVKNDEFPLVDSAEYSIVARRFEEFNNASKIKTSFAIPCQIRTTIS